jgi:hypothetical protein
MYGVTPGTFGRIELTTSFFPLAWILYLVTPNVVIDRQAPQRCPWGRCSFDLPPGSHELHVSFPYMFSDHCGPATIMVPVYEGHATAVRYEAPFFMFSEGSMQVVGTAPMQPHTG